MSKYSTFNYGSGTHYGSTAVATNTVTWIVLVDWNGDGALDGSNEAQYLIDCTIRNGREEYLNGNGSGFDHNGVGTATLVFDNTDNRYDPRNASSPLYPNVKPGRQMQILIRDNSDESVMTLFTGIIDQIEPQGYRGEVTITCVDYMQWLMDQQMSFSAELFNTTISGALEHLLTQAQYPGRRNLSTTSYTLDTQPIWVFAVDGQNAAETAHQIADAGLGIFYIDEHGTAFYQPRNRSISASAITQTVFSKNPRVSQPWDGVYNHVTVTALRYVKQQPAPVFTLPEAVYIATGGSETVYVNYDPSTEVQVYEIVGNTRADGEGSALTLTATTISLGLTGGYVTIANNSGTNGYLVELNIRGRKYADTIQKFVASDSTSQASYGLRKFQLESPYLQDRNYAASFATTLKNFLKDDRESLILEMRGKPTWMQYGLGIMDYIHFTSATLGIDGVDYQILGLEHKWMTKGGQDIFTTWYCHRTLVDTTSITSSSLEIAPRVPPAPDGYDGAGNDGNGTGSGTSSPVTIAVYHNGTFVGNASELNFLDSDYTP